MSFIYVENLYNYMRYNTFSNITIHLKNHIFSRQINILLNFLGFEGKEKIYQISDFILKIK